MDQCRVPVVLLCKAECVCKSIQCIKLMNEARKVTAHRNHLETENSLLSVLNIFWKTDIKKKAIDYHSIFKIRTQVKIADHGGSNGVFWGCGECGII